MAVPDAAILITTRNRHEDLRRALRSAVAQEGIVVEILVLDDGSTDGTAEVVRTEFPSVRLERRETSRGYIVRRNEGVQLALAPIVFSIDDDAEFSSARVVEQTLAEFIDERIGAVAIPFINVPQNQSVQQRAPSIGFCYVTDTYIGTAHAIRRDTFLKLRGYRETLVHQGEEKDFCLRLMTAGKVVRLGNADPINHYESSRRDWSRMDYYGWRNNVLFVWKYVPVPILGFALLKVALSWTYHAFRLNRSRRPMFLGLYNGFKSCFTYRAERSPVSAEIYRLLRQLQRSGPLVLSDVEPILAKFNDPSS